MQVKKRLLNYLNEVFNPQERESEREIVVKRYFCCESILKQFNLIITLFIDRSICWPKLCQVC